MNRIVIGLLVAVLMSGCAGRGEPEEYRNGLIALKNKDYEKGVEFLARVVEVHPGTIYAAEAMYHMGLAYHRGLMDQERAEECYRQYLGNFPGHAYKHEAMKGLGDCLYWQDKFEEALKVYGQLLEENPGEEWIPYQMVMCRYHQGRYRECRLLAEDFIGRRPKSSYVPSMLYRVADCYEREENWIAAGHSYDRLIGTYPLHELRWSAKRELARLADKLPSPTPTLTPETVEPLRPGSGQAPAGRSGEAVKPATGKPGVSE